MVAPLGGLSAYLSVCAYVLLSFVQYSMFMCGSSRPSENDKVSQILETHEEGSEWRSD